MSEVASTNEPTIDPATGEVVGGLAGLRELIRLKQTLSASDADGQTDGNPSADTPDDGKTGETATSAKVGVARKRRRRRRRNNEASSRTNDGVQGGNQPDDPDNDQWQLPIDRQQIIYGEIIKKDAMVDDVRLFVSSDDKLYVYTAALYPDNADEYKRAAARLLNSQSTFAMACVAGVQLFVNKRAHLTVGQGSLIYLDEYRIDSSNERVFAMAKKLLDDQRVNNQSIKTPRTSNDDTSDKQSTDMSETTSTVTKVFHLGDIAGDARKAKPDRSNTQLSTDDESNDQHGDGSSRAVHMSVGKSAQKKSGSNQPVKPTKDVSGRILKALKLAKQAAKEIANGDNVEISHIMEIILLVGKVSSDALAELLSIDEATADDYIDQLRLMHALGFARADGTYPILISSLDELGKDVSYTLASEADNFRSVVHYEIVRGKKLVYDLDQVFMLKLADEYIQCVAEYCRAASSSDIEQLFDQATSEVRLSTVLQVVSGDKTHESLNTAEYDLFHRYVTKYMIAAGWVSPNPTDGFPWVQLQVPGTNGLAVDTMRYISANLSWISCVYTDNIMLSLAKQLSEVATPTVHGGYSLQQILCGEIRQRLATLDQEERDGVYRLNSNQLSLTDVNKSTKIKSDEKSGSTADK